MFVQDNDFTVLITCLVFFLVRVSFYYSNDVVNFMKLGIIYNKRLLIRESKTNDIRFFDMEFYPKKIRDIKVVGDDAGKAPVWHHVVGLPSWIFIDEVEGR